MVLIKYSGKYVKIYFNMKITYSLPCQLAALQACVYLPPFRWLPVRLS